MGLLKGSWGLGLVLASGFAAAQEAPRNHASKYLNAYVGQALTTLGSEDVRYGFAFGYGFGKPERRFRFHSIPAQLVYEGYLLRTTSRFHYAPHRSSWAVGGLAYSRWFWPRNEKGWGMYGGVGIGLQVVEFRSRDLNSTINSTPVLDIGGTFESGNREYLIGLRLLHISNAGTKEPNQGENLLFLTLGMRF